MPDFVDEDMNLSTYEGPLVEPIRNRLIADKGRLETLSANLSKEGRILDIKVAEALDNESIRTHDNFHSGVYWFTGPVHSESIGGAMGFLNYWRRVDPDKPLQFVFTSPGGNIVDGFVLFDAIQMARRAGMQIETGALGGAFSMGAVLVQAGSPRWMTPESWLMLHEGSTGLKGSFGEVKDGIKWFEMLKGRAAEIYVANSNGKLTKRRLEKEWNRTDWFVSSDEALKLGLVDEVR